MAGFFFFDFRISSIKKITFHEFKLSTQGNAMVRYQHSIGAWLLLLYPLRVFEPSVDGAVLYRLKN